MTTRNIAHRGASAVAPENTLAAFEAARQLGADGIEFDVQLSADGIPVVIHDTSVDRTTDGRGLVRRLPLARLAELDAGAHLGTAFAGQRIPTLEQVLEAYAGTGLLLNIELKSWRLGGDGLADAVLALVAAAGCGGHTLISSFNPLLLRHAGRMAPHVATGLIYNRSMAPLWRSGVIAAIALPQADHPSHSLVNDSFLAKARRQGRRVNPWTVDEPQEMRRLVTLDVDGIITNRPGLLRDVIAATAHAPAT